MCSRDGLERLNEACIKGDNATVELIGRKCGYSTNASLRNCDDVRKHILASRDVTPGDYSNPNYQGRRFHPSQRPYNNMYDLSIGIGCEEGSYYLPVVRYATPGGGLYYSYVGEHKRRAKCGVFYFYEPSSTTFLNLGETLVAPNKVGAFLSLWESPIARKALLQELPIERRYKEAYESDIIKLKADPNEYAENRPSNYKIFRDFPVRSKDGNYEIYADTFEDYFLIYSKIRYDDYIETLAPITVLISSPDDVPKIPFDGAIQIETLISPNMGEKLPPHYRILHEKGNEEEMEYYVEIPTNALYYGEDGKYEASPLSIGFFDRLDEPLCIMARANGIDTLIFQHEPGENSANTEILDTRSSEKSYDNLCRVINDVNIVHEYPTIWFPSEGFYQYIGKRDEFEMVPLPS